MLGTDDTTGVLPVSCGEPDLRDMLPRECARKGLQVPPVLRRYCNVKKPFCAHTGGKSGGMAAMLQTLDLPLTGHHHRGIDDARNIAKIVAHRASTRVPLDVTGGLRPTGLDAAREAALTSEFEANAAAWATLMAAPDSERQGATALHDARAAQEAQAELRKQHILATQQWERALPPAERAFVEQLQQRKKAATKAAMKAVRKAASVHVRDPSPRAPPSEDAGLVAGRVTRPGRAEEGESAAALLSQAGPRSVASALLGLVRQLSGSAAPEDESSSTHQSAQGNGADLPRVRRERSAFRCPACGMALRATLRDALTRMRCECGAEFVVAAEGVEVR